MSSKTINKILKLSAASAIILCISHVYGCGSSPVLKLVEKSEKMGLVYIYRPKKFYYGSKDFSVNANGFKINRLKNGGYFHYMARPGRIQFSARSETTSTVILDVEGGQTYYIRGAMTKGQLIGRPQLKVISPEVGKNELLTCWKKIKEKTKKRSVDNRFTPDPEE